jgi:hypothetical protein
MAASLVAVLSLVAIGIGFVFPQQLTDDIGYPPTKIPQSRAEAALQHADALKALRLQYLASIRSHIAQWQSGATLIDRPDPDRDGLREHVCTIESHRGMTKILLGFRFWVLDDFLVVGASHDYRITSPHWLISAHTEGEQVQEWLDGLNALLKQWDDHAERICLGGSGPVP